MIARQRGLSLLGLMVVIALAGVIGIVVLQLIPVYTEFFAAKTAIVKARDAGSTPIEIRSAFDRHATIDRIESITAKDLQISKAGDRHVVAFNYERKVPLFANVSLAIDFSATTAGR